MRNPETPLTPEQEKLARELEGMDDEDEELFLDHELKMIKGTEIETQKDIEDRIKNWNKDILPLLETSPLPDNIRTILGRLHKTCIEESGKDRKETGNLERALAGRIPRSH